MDYLVFLMHWLVFLSLKILLVMPGIQTGPLEYQGPLFLNQNPIFVQQLKSEVLKYTIPSRYLPIVDK